MEHVIIKLLITTNGGASHLSGARTSDRGDLPSLTLSVVCLVVCLFSEDVKMVCCHRARGWFWSAIRFFRASGRNGKSCGSTCFTW